MPNYQNSKIYVLRSHQTEKIYIGSTCNELRKRFNQHKTLYKRFNEKKHNIYATSYEILKFDDCYIELYEKYPCTDRNELNKKEGEIIRSLDCVNKCIAGRTTNQYNKDNKEYLKEKTKEWKEKNKEIIKQKQKEHDQKRKEKRKEQRRLYYQQNKEKLKEKRRLYYQQKKK